MRLLKVKTLEFQEFAYEAEIPPYAILSHTWGDDEVTFKDMTKRRVQAEGKKGFDKISRCAEQACHDGLDYCFTDTCCINKNSSAELSEAINSMFRWYRNSTTCYAYLSDVPTKPEGDSSMPQGEWTKRFKASRWFTRGWTLQELIAPRDLTFFSGDWTEIGKKSDLLGFLESVTGIPAETLLTGDASTSSVAQRMSWAAHRSTSRTEDLAYCLMGIFDVNMAMLYGEGEKAFLRLQEEIIKTSDDRSIFAWCDPTASFSTYRGLLARRPSDFSKCKEIIWSRRGHEPYRITNMGIQLDFQLIPRQSHPNEFIAPLFGVSNRTLGAQVCVGVYLQQVGTTQYARVQLDQLALFQDASIRNKTVLHANPFIRQKTVMEILNHSRAAGIFLHLLTPSLAISEAHPTEIWNERSLAFLFNKAPAEGSPPRMMFSVTGSSTLEKLTVVIDVHREWGELVTIEGGWRKQQRVNQSQHTVYCRKPAHAVIVLTLQRALVGSELRMMLGLEENSAL